MKTTLLREMAPDFSWWRNADGRRETFVGLTAAVLVVPQAITFAYLAGVAPEYGLYCAIFVGLLSSLFGRSPMLGGPNTAVAILMGVTVLPFAGRGSPMFLEFILALSLAIGAIQLLIWLVRGGVLFRYFNPAAITGIKIGVGVLLVTASLEGCLGLSMMGNGFFFEKFYVVATSWPQTVNPWAATISGITIASGLLLKRRWPRTAIVGATLAGSLAGLLLYGWFGPERSQIELLGHVTLQTMPLHLPHLGPQHWLFLERVIPQALAIAVLGLSQSLVIARDLRASHAPDVDLHKEVFAQAIANLLGPFFCAFAGSGSFNRTSVAVGMGSRTPLAGLVAAGGVVLCAVALGPMLTWLPMPVVGGVMALVGLSMIRLDELRPLRDRMDGPVLLSTLIAVAFLGLETGLIVAVAASILCFVVNASHVKWTVQRDGDRERIQATGNLFYASVDRLADHLRRSTAVDTVLDLRRVPYCDRSARHTIESIRRERRMRGRALKVETA
jgi:SulP family sulfate permease